MGAVLCPQRKKVVKFSVEEQVAIFLPPVIVNSQAIQVDQSTFIDETINRCRGINVRGDRCGIIDLPKNVAFCKYHKDQDNQASFPKNFGFK